MLCTSAFNFMKDKLLSVKGNYCEIGIFEGDSLSQLAKMYPEKRFYGIDPFIEDGHTSHITSVARGQTMNQQKQRTIQNIDGLQNLLIFQMTSSQFSKNINEETIAALNIDWVLVDGSHHYDDVCVDIILAMYLIGDKPGGIIFDDLHQLDVKLAYDKFVRNFNYKISEQQYLTDDKVVVVHKVN